jgi:serine/threonine protein phosphatase PrpC
MAVFDGHGQEGEKVSQYLSTTLPTMLANSPNFKASHPLVPA